MIRILLVDEYPLFRKGLSIILSENFTEFEVVGEASSKDEAIEKIDLLKPDVVIMDVLMTNKNSIEVIQSLHQKFTTLNLLVLSVSDESEELFRAIKAGASGYILSTADLKELSESIRIVARGDSTLSPQLIGKLMSEFKHGSGGGDQHFYLLTRREREILKYAAQGFSNKEIAEHCLISLTTVKAHFRNILGKLEVKNRTGAVTMANSHGLLDNLSDTLPSMSENRARTQPA